MALYEIVYVSLACEDLTSTQLYKLWEGPIAERSYANWSMAFVDQALIEAMPQAVDPAEDGQGLAHSVKGSMGKKFLLSVRDELLQRQRSSA